MSHSCNPSIVFSLSLQPHHSTQVSVEAGLDAPPPNLRGGELKLVLHFSVDVVKGMIQGYNNRNIYSTAMPMVIEQAQIGEVLEATYFFYMCQGNVPLSPRLTLLLLWMLFGRVLFQGL